MVLKGKKILIGVSGSIAAYKIPFLVRLLVKKGCEVRVMMTRPATSFVSPLTLSTLTNHSVDVDFFDHEKPQKGWVNHVDLGLWADVLILAPVTSNTLSKLASGKSDNLLTATFMSSRCPVFFAPAMDLDMYHNEATKSNIEALVSRGYHLIPSESGELASGLEGEGRMAEPEHILLAVESKLSESLPLLGKKVMINAGPTKEAIDPVRYIGNHATGKMGHALAKEAAKLGADVHFILGPTDTAFDLEGMQVTRVVSADEMYEACADIFPKVDIAIFSAAIADYKPKEIFAQKVKKSDADMHIALVPNIDILKTLGHKKQERQTVIGFALETENLIDNARKKLHTKNADFIVCNVSGEHTGFAHDTNEVWILSEDKEEIHFPLKDKSLLATDLWAYFIEHID
ncbi:MAG: bifunctional phosphopantothenoylcysteine decarboxylase/phosphopantothenate--cysteine ligase CoaBC [Cryomorphaceae bacterium]|nr:bifunctional phosphopantothenoylcysteine decarboxylase/phosphopantothenate--cysteine ligase CoaBC [Cryomorphaceae bacterium]